MATIVFASSKGGVAKTTSAHALATMLAKQVPVTVIDADPNKPFEAWAKLGDVPENLTIVTKHDGIDLSQDNIMEAIEAAEATSAFTIVDLEGSRSTAVSFAINLADLVITPMSASQLEASEAIKVLSMVRRNGRSLNREIPFRILFTRTPAAIRTRGMDAIQAQLAAAGITTFETHLHDREAFRAVFIHGGTLDSPALADAITNVAKARENQRAFAQEVVAVLKEIGQ